MSDNATKAREFWLEKVEDEDKSHLVVWEMCPFADPEMTFPKDDFIHVIEKKAYDALQKQFDEAKAKTNSMIDSYEFNREAMLTAHRKLEAENTRLREALKKIKSLSDTVIRPAMTRVTWEMKQALDSCYNEASEALKKEGGE